MEWVSVFWFDVHFSWPWISSCADQTLPSSSTQLPMFFPIVHPCYWTDTYSHWHPLPNEYTWEADGRHQTEKERQTEGGKREVETQFKKKTGHNQKQTLTVKTNIKDSHFRYYVPSLFVNSLLSCQTVNKLFSKQWAGSFSQAHAMNALVDCQATFLSSRSPDVWCLSHSLSLPRDCAQNSHTKHIAN